MSIYQLQQRIKAHRDAIPKYKKSKEDKATLEFVEERLEFLKEYRRGTGWEDLWRAADKAYIPHVIDSAKNTRKVFVSDDELGWRSAKVDLATESSWQEDSVSPNPYIKIQTALGIIVDRNPTAVMTAGKEIFEKNTNLISDLHKRSWEIASSKSALLKPAVFNAAKYGIGIGRTYPLTITRDVDDLVEYKANGKSKYETKSFTYFDDVFRESITPWNVWFDDAAIVGNPFSTNDVFYFKDYEWSRFERNFKHLKNFKFVVPTERVVDNEGNIASEDNGTGDSKSSKMVERVWFYENLELDTLFIWTDSGVVLVNEPMPQRPKNKRLSVWSFPWTLRDDKSINGIGVYEAMRNDHKIHNKIRNMTVDQLVLSIYREWFYSGADTLEADGQMKTHPGRGRQVNNPKDITWNNVPGPGQEAWLGLEHFDKRIDDVTGISKSLQGEVTGSTAFEISQARESALRRMKTPLENITDGLTRDAYISIGIFEDLYAVPKIKLIAEDRFIEPFELEQYQREDGGELIEGEDFETEFREVTSNLEKNDDGLIQQTEKMNFFRISPEDVVWEGIVSVNGQSIVANSELLDRVTTVELANIIVPLFAGDPSIGMKPAKQILKKYNEDPNDWLPDHWLNPPAPVANPLFVNPEENGQPEQTGLETVTDTIPAMESNSGNLNIALGGNMK